MDIEVCGESREQVEERPERWRFAPGNECNEGKRLGKRVSARMKMLKKNAVLYDLEKLAVRKRQRAELQVAEIQMLSFGSDQDGQDEEGEHQRGQPVAC